MKLKNIPIATKAAFPDRVTHKDLFNLHLSEGTIVNITTRCADNPSGFMEMVKQKLIASKIMHNDETGINIRGILHWLHTAGNKDYTYLFPHKRRGQVAFDEIGILPEFTGISVHDFWKPYEKYDCSHVYCNAHLIRELTFAHENLKQQWASKMISLIFDIKEKVDLSEEHFLKENLISEFIRNIIK